MKRILIRLPHGTSEILVGAGLLADLDRRLEEAGLEGPYLLVSQPRIIQSAGRGLAKKYPVALIPDGERAKTLTNVSKLIDRMIGLKLTRQSTIIAFGGGVVGDVAAFAASIYLRGVAVVQVPTTLLAQVDAAVGGKTGINLPNGKNLVASTPKKGSSPTGSRSDMSKISAVNQTAKTTWAECMNVPLTRMGTASAPCQPGIATAANRNSST